MYQINQNSKLYKVLNSPISLVVVLFIALLYFGGNVLSADPGQNHARPSCDNPELWSVVSELLRPTYTEMAGFNSFTPGAFTTIDVNETSTTCSTIVGMSMPNVNFTVHSARITYVVGDVQEDGTFPIEVYTSD